MLTCPKLLFQKGILFLADRLLGMLVQRGMLPALTCTLLFFLLQRFRWVVARPVVPCLMAVI
jgi:hypothetical protein